jgi:hypothetical protein
LEAVVALEEPEGWASSTGNASFAGDRPDGHGVPTSVKC